MGMEVAIILYILSLVTFIQCPYPPTGDEVVPGSVLLPASRRGRYLANIVRRQAVDGTGIKFNKDADRMNAEAKKKVDVLSEELLPYIIAEQERRTTLHKRVMTAIQNGEKGVTIAEMRNKPPLIIRKGLMYRCPANRAPKEPDGSGTIMCEDDITPTQIMFDACLSAEDKELYNAENRFFFCNRHKVEGPDLPRNGTTVYGCAPMERTSYNYTTAKCSLEDTEDVVVHYRYYPDRTYKYVTELDSDREVCDHWNPCQIGYIFSLPSLDMATPATELWPESADTPEDYEKDEIVPPIPEDSNVEYVHLGQPYTTSPRTMKLPEGVSRRFNIPGFLLKLIKVKNNDGQVREIPPDQFSITLGLNCFTITLSFSKVTLEQIGTYFATIALGVTNLVFNIVTLVASAIEAVAETVDCLFGQLIDMTSISLKCMGCRVLGLMVRSRDNNVYNVPSSNFKAKSANKQININVTINSAQSHDFGDYFAIVENSRGQEERHKILTVRAPDNDANNLIELNRFEASCDVRGNYNNMTQYKCEGCELNDVLCNGQSVQAAGRVTIIPQSQQISYNFPSFSDQFACVYVGFFKIKDKVYRKVVAVIENASPSVKIAEVIKIKAPKDGENFTQVIKYDCNNCIPKEVIVNGIVIPPADTESTGKSDTSNQAVFRELDSGSISIEVSKFTEAYVGLYQTIFLVGDDNVTKTVMEITGEGEGGGGGDHGGGGSGGDNSDVKLEIYATSAKDKCEKEIPYECGENCKLTAVECLGKPVDATKVKIDEATKKIEFAIAEFKDNDACVYMGNFDINGTPHKQVVAVIENGVDETVKITDPNQLKKVAKDSEETVEVVYACEGTGITVEVTVNGVKVDKAELKEADKKISIPIKGDDAHVGYYQAKFTIGDKTYTKNILQVALA